MTEQQYTLTARAMDLIARSQQTDMPGHEDFFHFQSVLQERQEALQILELMLAKDEVKTKQFVSLKSRVFKTVGAAIAAKIGSEWVGNSPELSPERRLAVAKFLSELRLLITWAAAQVKQVEEVRE
jgi:hypothetical protein